MPASACPAFRCPCSGFSLGHNLGIGTLGGLTPFVITSIEALGRTGVYSAAYWITGGSVCCLLARAVLGHTAPHLTHTRSVIEARAAAAATGLS